MILLSLRASPRAKQSGGVAGLPLQLSAQGHTVGRFSQDTNAVSGYARPDKAKEVANTAYIQEFTLDRGKVVLFAESMTFRMFWRGTTKLLVNALLFEATPRSP